MQIIRCEFVESAWWRTDTLRVLCVSSWLTVTGCFEWKHTNTRNRLGECAPKTESAKANANAKLNRRSQCCVWWYQSAKNRFNSSYGESFASLALSHSLMLVSQAGISPCEWMSIFFWFLNRQFLRLEKPTYVCLCECRTTTTVITCKCVVCQFVPTHECFMHDARLP